jgi:integrase/recombinase XerD
LKPPTIRIELYKGKTLADGRHPVCITVTSKGVPRRKSVASALPSEWNEEKHCLKRTRKDHETVNNNIDTEYTKYKAIFNTLKLGSFLPEDVFKEHKSSSPLFHVNALGYLKTLEPSTADTRASRLRKIMRYVKEKDFRIDQINDAWISGFRLHCKTKEKNAKGELGNSVNTINDAVKLIGRVASFAGSKITLPAMKHTKTIKSKLNIAEIAALFNVECTPGTNLWHTKNTAMLQYYLRGMRIGDALKMEWSMISNGRLFYGTSKTDYEHSIKIIPQCQAILDLYKRETKYVLPWIRVEDLDKTKLFKEIKDRTVVINSNLKLLAEKALITKRISSHTLRHSFARNSDILLGGDLKAIQGMLGHNRRSQTEHYIEDLRETDELDDAADKVFG